MTPKNVIKRILVGKSRLVRQSPVPMSLVKENSLDITGAKKIYQVTMTCGYEIFVSLGSITSAMSEFAL